MDDQMWLEGLRAEYRYNLLYADLNARIRNLRVAMARRHVWYALLTVGVIVGVVAVAALALC